MRCLAPADKPRLGNVPACSRVRVFVEVRRGLVEKY